MDRIGIIMHGVTGRMGYNQHLVRSILAIRDQGGVELADGRAAAGRSDHRRAQRREDGGAGAASTGSSAGATDLDAALANPDDTIFFDAGTTLMRAGAARRRRSTRASTSTARSRSPTTSASRWRWRGRRAARGSSTGWCRTSCSCRACRSCAILRDSGFFGRMLSVGASSATGCSRATGGVDPQRPSWNYRKGDGGGIILDMLCHWRYVLDDLFGEVKAVSCLGATHIPERIDEKGKPYAADADDAAYATFELDGRGDRADQLVLGRAGAPRRPRDLPGRRHPRLGGGGADEVLDASAGSTPRSRCGTPTSRRRSTSSTMGGGAGHRQPTTTASRRSGRCSCATSSRTRPGPTLVEAGRRACSSPSSG